MGFFGGESCQYLKVLKGSNRGRFFSQFSNNHQPESWFDLSMYGSESIYSFDLLLKKVEIWLKMNENICDIELVKQVALNNLKKSKLIEEDHCVICYSNKPS